MENVNEHLHDLDTVGRIFDIQRYSLHDGRGIRTIVFFKGCALRCRWCCNPESQSYEIEPMKELSGEGTKTVGRDVTVAEVMQTVRRDIPYYRRSGGGVTLSGGEALLQRKFAASLLRVCKSEGIHTAVETTAIVDRATLEECVPLLDQVLLDIKNMDSEKHFKFTSQHNERILDNARWIAEHANELIIRVPVIPGFNDTDAEIRAIAKFASSLPNVKNLHLLPYHRLGQDKYTALGRPYLMGDVKPPEPAYMRRLLSVAEESGLFCQIGG